MHLRDHCYSVLHSNFDMVDQVGSSSHTVKDSFTRRASMNTIESSVTRLLVSTKHLLESLTQWARQRADDKFVSDAYVKLGNDFRAASRAFTNAGVDISDLGNVPKALRIVLESALSEAPTQENLDRFLPNIRNIIVNLLLNLKAKQQIARQVAEANTVANRMGSESTTKSADGYLPLHLPKITSPAPSLSLTKSRSGPANQMGSIQDSEGPEASNDKKFHPKQTNTPSSDALAKLQKGNVILRRASKRFSAYQFAKLANLNNNQLPRIASDTCKSPEIGFDEGLKIAPGNEGQENRQSHPGKLSVFMRVNETTKKVIILVPATLASLRLQFVEKFAYSPGSEAFPDIYVFDAASSVWFELEDHRMDEDIKDGSLLCLRETLEESPSFKSLESKLDHLMKRFDDFDNVMITEFKDLLRSLSLNATPVLVHSTEIGGKSQEFENSKIFSEIIRELKGVQSLLNSRNNAFQVSLKGLTLEIDALKTAGLLEGNKTSNRNFMQQSYMKLSEDSDNLLTKVDDLQDIMEALRKDVAQRGVRLGPKQLKSTRKEIVEAQHSLTKLTSYISDGKTTWKKIWEAELDKVCEEQQFFNLQDDLTSDLEEDIKKIQETFDLIEKCSLEQSKQASLRRAIFPSITNLQEPGESLQDLRDAVMSEVAALIPDHETRLDAIAKAEKLRQKDRELLSVSQFQEELGDFVEDNRFKNSGGIEELERRRQEKNSENLKLSLGII